MDRGSERDGKKIFRFVVIEVQEPGIGFRMGADIGRGMKLIDRRHPFYDKTMNNLSWVDILHGRFFPGHRIFTVLPEG
jgi:hypothetical protein